MNIYYVADAINEQGAFDQSTYWHTSKTAAIRAARIRYGRGWTVAIRKIEVSDREYTGQIVYSEEVYTFRPRG